MNVQRLVDTAYPRLSRADKEQMVIDHLLRVLDNRALQRHMLTIQPETVVDLVQAVDEYMAVGGAESRHSQVSARVVEAEGPPQPDLSVLAKVLEAQSLLSKQAAGQGGGIRSPTCSCPTASATGLAVLPKRRLFPMRGSALEEELPTRSTSRPQGSPGRQPGPRGRYSPSPTAQQSGNGGGPVRP